MDYANMIDTAKPVLVAFGLKVLGAVAIYVVGRWLIGILGTLIQKALERQRIEPTVIRYVGNTINVALNVLLVIGILGYHRFAGLGWVDSFYSASMIMSGMGPTETLRTREAKIFAGIYALYSGLVLIASTGVVLSPFMARVLHAFHAERDEGGGRAG